MPYSFPPFSAPASTGFFGSAPAPATGGLFGSTSAPSAGGLFGSTPAPATGGLFGTAAPAPGTSDTITVSSAFPVLSNPQSFAFQHLEAACSEHLE